MKVTHPLFLLCLLLPFFFSQAQAEPGKIAATTYFQWQPGSEQIKNRIKPQNAFHLRQGSFTVTGPPALYGLGKELLKFLSDSEQQLSSRYHFESGNRQFVIPLVTIDSLKGSDSQLSLFSESSSQMVFPFPIGETTALTAPSNRFALFSLLHTIVKADLAFGSQQRLPISSHAFRFVDGISGFLALELITGAVPGETGYYLDLLDAIHQKREAARRFSAAQLLAQNANSEDTDILAGLNQFFSGIRLTRNSEAAINLPDGSSAADRIRLFQWVQANKGATAIRSILDHLSRSSNAWVIEEKAEDSFCRQYIHFGCQEKTMDGTRSDIILQQTTGMTFAQLLKQSKQNQGPASPPSLPHYPVYGFNYPKAGGANENRIGAHAIHDRITISAGDILDSETVAMNGASFTLGIRDEIYQVQIQIDYLTGQKRQDKRLTISSSSQIVPQTITSTDLKIGSRVLKTGYHTGWVDELGVYFHWKRVQVEWDTQQIPGKRTDIEYINSGFFLLDVQNYKALMLARAVTLGLNYDFQLGLVNQSGSVLLVRGEKYNTDTSNLVLGLNLGPEMRINLSSLPLEIRLGGSADLLWQPMEDKGGSRDQDNEINASQSRIHLYATLGLLF
jgi:hypothetical protein